MLLSRYLKGYEEISNEVRKHDHGLSPELKLLSKEITKDIDNAINVISYKITNLWRRKIRRRCPNKPNNYYHADTGESINSVPVIWYSDILTQGLHSAQ